MPNIGVHFDERKIELNYLRLLRRTLIGQVFLLGLMPDPAWSADTLPSWNIGPAKQSIIEFVKRVTTPGSKDFVPQSDRIAVFDNDGTMWSEQPIYFQLLFAFDRIRALSAQHPEWQDKPIFRAILAGDMKGVMADGERGLLEINDAAQGNSTPEEFKAIVIQWLETARHPKSHMLYTEMVFQPMVEMLDFLRANGFKTYLCSGGDVEFMRAWSEQVYGIPPEQVIGSNFTYRLTTDSTASTIMIVPTLELLNDKATKAINLHKILGRRPIIAVGNSDGDLPMLEWTAAGGGPRLIGVVHHTDADREAAYDRTSPVGRLDKALDVAMAKGWTVIDMKRDWKVVFSSLKQ